MVAVLLAACTATETSNGWAAVPLDASAVTWLDDWYGVAVAGGQAAGNRPLLARVDRDEVVAIDVGDTGSVWSLVTDPMMFVAVDDDDPTTNPQGWWVDEYPRSPSLREGPGEVYAGEPWLPTDSSGRPPDRLWFTTEDEGAAAVGGFLDEDGLLGLLPLDWCHPDLEFMPGPPQLYLAADASAADLLVRGVGGSYVVVGPVSPEPDATSVGRQVWITSTCEHAWNRLHLAPDPDVITDARGWLDLYVAGAVGGRPVVVDVLGPALEVPDQRLDPSDPVVLIAEVPAAPDEDRPSVVLQTVDGAILYRPTRDGGWATISLPPGRARRAVITRDDHGTVTAYALVDDRLWWHDLADLD